MGHRQIDTAVILAAGIGKRLRPLTNSKPKCLVNVAGRPILCHMLDALDERNFQRVIVVTGYREEAVRNFLQVSPSGPAVELINNDLYDKTNNIYSLRLAADAIGSDDFLLLESDLVFDPGLLDPLIVPDRIALAPYLPEIHNGTTAIVNDHGELVGLNVKGDSGTGGGTSTQQKLYKTVNITSFSNSVWEIIFNLMEEMIENGDLQQFYEVAIARTLEQDAITLRMVDFSCQWWDEIDNLTDLERVRQAILKGITPLSEQLRRIQVDDP